jgi:hypothetical protein
MVLFAALIGLIVSWIEPSPGNALPYSILFLFLPLAFLVWALSPRYYAVTANAVQIRRPFSTISLLFSDIVDIRSIESGELGFNFRLIASGGFFGYLGLYRSSKIGLIFMWCTNKDNLVLITCESKAVVISPSDSSAFLLDYNQRSR